MSGRIKEIALTCVTNSKRSLFIAISMYALAFFLNGGSDPMKFAVASLGIDDISSEATKFAFIKSCLFGMYVGYTTKSEICAPLIVSVATGMVVANLLGSVLKSTLDLSTLKLRKVKKPVLPELAKEPSPIAVFAGGLIGASVVSAMFNKSSVEDLEAV